MCHLYHKGEMVLNSINQLISIGHRIITTKTIKGLNDIEKSDRSNTNWIWLNLAVLEKHGFIRLVKNAPRKKYELPKEELNMIEVLKA